MDIDRLEKLASIYLEAAERNEYQKNLMRERYHSKRQALIAELGGKCSRCGSKKNLQIDHKDRKKKEFRAADVHSVSDERLQKAKKNFQVLCEECHRDKTHESWDYGGNKSQHGSYWRYRKHGCRCKKCTEAFREANRRWKQMSRERERKILKDVP